MGFEESLNSEKDLSAVKDEVIALIRSLINVEYYISEDEPFSGDISMFELGLDTNISHPKAEGAVNMVYFEWDWLGYDFVVTGEDRYFCFYYVWS